MCVINMNIVWDKKYTKHSVEEFELNYESYGVGSSTGS